MLSMIYNFVSFFDTTKTKESGGKIRPRVTFLTETWQTRIKQTKTVNVAFVKTMLNNVFWVVCTNVLLK